MGMVVLTKRMTRALGVGRWVGKAEAVIVTNPSIHSPIRIFILEEVRL